MPIKEFNVLTEDFVYAIADQLNSPDKLMKVCERSFTSGSRTIKNVIFAKNKKSDQTGILFTLC